MATIRNETVPETVIILTYFQFHSDNKERLQISTLTKEQQQAITEYLGTHDIPSGIGTSEGACSIAAINLTLTGELTDRIPDCMSEVIGNWIIVVQDSMPNEMRNSMEWKRLLPLAAGTGRTRETERLQIVLNWMWLQVLPSLQDLADSQGFGVEWEVMCAEKN